MSKLYKIQGKVFRLEPELHRIIRQAGIGRKEIETEYAKMMSCLPGSRYVNYNNAAYSAFMKKGGGFKL